VLDYLHERGHESTAAVLLKGIAERAHLEPKLSVYLDKYERDPMQASRVTASKRRDGMFRATPYFHSTYDIPEISSAILNGQIDTAISLLRRYFPETIDEDLSQAKYDESPWSSMEVTRPHLLIISLRMQAFVESFRSKPLPNSPSPEPTEPESPPEDAMSSPEHFEPADERMLLEAQRIWTAVGQLQDPSERKQYQTAMKNVSELLGYHVPEKSPAARLFSQRRRHYLAEQVDTAILSECPSLSQSSFLTLTVPLGVLGLPRYSDLEWTVRQLNAVTRLLHDYEMPLPSRSQRPEGLRSPSPERGRTLGKGVIRDMDMDDVSAASQD
jgi:hypothetical protein